MAAVRHLGLFSKRFPSCPYIVGNPPNQQDYAITRLNTGFYPNIWMSLKNAVAMYWRVKKWKYSLEMEWSEVDIQNYSYSEERELYVGQVSILNVIQDYIDGVLYPVEPLFDTLEGDIPSSETKLICGVGGATLSSLANAHFVAQILGSIRPDNDPSAGTGFFTRMSWPFFSNPVYVRDNNGAKEYLPTIEFSANTFRWTKIAAYPWTIPSGQPYLGTYGEFSYKFLGETLSCPIYAYNSRSTVPEFNNNLSVNVTLEATEYWEYDPQDGEGPIYDKQTGKAIRAFPAIS